tara:strand:+ start:388 stop:849 length:462 start_codon:yes stop_codon:yes gene_type:complete
MPLREKIESEYKSAVKSKDKSKISTYRLILSGIKDLDILNRSASNKRDTDDSDILKLLKKMIKQRNESIEVYKNNEREDLMQIEQQEVKILSNYLPKQLNEDETRNLCKETAEKLKANNIKDMGKVIGELKKSHSNNLDFSIAGKVLKEILNK